MHHSVCVLFVSPSVYLLSSTLHAWSLVAPPTRTRFITTCGHLVTRTVFCFGNMLVFTCALLSGDRGRSRKWKEMLKPPPVAQCLYLKDDIGTVCPLHYTHTHTLTVRVVTLVCHTPHTLTVRVATLVCHTNLLYISTYNLSLTPLYLDYIQSTRMSIL